MERGHTPCRLRRWRRGLVVTTAAIWLCGATRAEAGRPWWKSDFADSQSMACTIWHEATRLARGEMQIRQLLPLLSDRRVVFIDTPAAPTSITVRDVAADILSEADAAQMRPTTRVKDVACCLKPNGTCNRVRIPDLTEGEFQDLIAIVSAQSRRPPHAAH